eukprot:CAMPEP_0179424802 /NCGR_PEP_ID=MMETSP0799-20121207/11806_1 /TAXON_ID=46947 /ORGANISM="Geminigera cryophila, Strain CCMP2564" /LENGTH=84 /DNA_ID=CAMNT_0021199325 /DNA_START=318 /DNA_END=569 /DNA_ORIENTATION=+
MQEVREFEVSHDSRVRAFEASRDSREDREDRDHVRQTGGAKELKKSTIDASTNEHSTKWKGVVIDKAGVFGKYAHSKHRGSPKR